MTATAAQVAHYEYMAWFAASMNDVLSDLAASIDRPRKLGHIIVTVAARRSVLRMTGAHRPEAIPWVMRRSMRDGRLVRP